MLRSVACVLLSLSVFLTTGFAQTGTQDQVSPATNASFNGDAPSLTWQQEVQTSLPGVLEGFKLTLTGNIGSQLNVSVRVGPGWNTTPASFTTLITKQNTASPEVVFVNCASAGITLSSGARFVIEMTGTGTAMGIVGSYVAPPGIPLYGPQLYLGSSSCFADCGWRLGLTTFMLTVPAPVVHCSAKLNSLGCLPAIASNGAASATANSGFTVSAANVRNQKSGLLIYSASGRSSAAFQGGTLCLNLPIRRSIPLQSGGTPAPTSDCTGIYAIDMNAFAQHAVGGNPAPFLRTSGTVVNCQFWGPDPGFPAPNNTTLSNALEYVVP